RVIAAGMVAGFQGEQLKKQLEGESLEYNFSTVPGETRTNLKVVDEALNVTTEINEPGFTVTGEQLKDFSDRLSGLLDEAGCLVIGGSLPQGAPDHIYRDFIELANGKGVRTILDADGPALREGIKARPYAIKPNLHELEQLVGHKLATSQDIIAAGRGLLEQGIALIIISMGSKGSIVMDDKEVYQVTPFKITPKSTVGAGDSMVAALVYALLGNKSLEEIALWATTAGTVTASKSGTQVCTLAEVQNLLSQVTTTKVAGLSC
ncbi:MAG TPA: 1-phosphofructokinase family hexose kinase, partial [Bacillota bacterium]|nr:1-phosphofructokinase family hexose kinase [Bacillota bacterium]